MQDNYLKSAENISLRGKPNTNDENILWSPVSSEMNVVSSLGIYKRHNNNLKNSI